MSIEREIEEALRRHAEDVRPRESALPEIEGRVRRAYTRRAVLGGLVAAAAVAAAVVVMPQLVRAPEGGFAGPGATPEPGSTTAPATPLELRYYRDEQLNVMLRYPTGWRDTRFEGHTTFIPRALSTGEGEGPQAGLEMWFDAGPYDEPVLASETNERITVSGRDAIRYEAGGDRRMVVVQVDWTGLWCGGFQEAAPPGEARPSACPRMTGPAKLVVMAFADDEDLWQEHGGAALSAFDTIEVASETFPPAGFEIRTRHGTVGGGVVYDGLTATLVEFMDRRVYEGGAEALLSDAASDDYSCEGGSAGVDLMNDCAESPLALFEVADREDTTEGARFTVHLVYADKGAGPEWITVGPEGSPDAPVRILRGETEDA